MEISGRVKHVGQDQQVTASFKKRELVVTTDEQYPQQILIEFVQDKTEYLDGYKVGEDVIVKINLRGREWINPQGETKYFNQIVGWQISRRVVQGPPPVSNPATNTQNFAPSTIVNEDEPDDLPF